MRWRRGALVLLLVVAVSGCGEASGRLGAESPAPSGTPTTSPSAEPTADPLALVGMWFVDAKDVPAGTVLRLGEELNLFGECGVLDGGWQAAVEGGLFLASANSGDGGCFTATGPKPSPWLDSAVRFGMEGDRRILFDRDGNRVAVLRPGAKPTVGPNRSAEHFTSTPTVSPSLKARAQAAAPLPAGIDSPSPERLMKRWAAPGAPDDSFVEFLADGRWRGSDGCNGQGGRYILGPQGRILSTSGPQTLIGCTGTSFGGLLGTATRVGIDKGQLVFVGQDGSELGRATATP